MLFRNNIENIITKRTSIRNYSNLSFDNSILTEIQKIINQKINTPFNNIPRFQLINKKDFSSEKLKLGTYGFISGAQFFIVGAISKNDFSSIDYGFALEQIILQLTEIEIGTCWLGGTFKRTNFGKAINLAENEIIPAITPVGHPADKRSMKEKIIRSFANAKSRKNSEELFYLNNFDTSLLQNTKTEYLKALEMVRLSPSAENDQPWRIIFADENKFHFYLKRKNIIKDAFPTVDLQKVDMGIAMNHFYLYLQSVGLNVRWHLDEELKFEQKLKNEYIVSAEII